MKKLGMLLLCLLCLLTFASCSNANEEEGKAEDEEEWEPEEEEVIEAEIQDASYILSGKDDGNDIEDEDGGLMQIDLQVENISDSSVQVTPEQHMQLYEGDQQIDPSKDTYPNLDLEEETNTNIDAGKQKNLSVLFEVEQDTEYKLSISPFPSDYEISPLDTTVSLDTSEYNDSHEALLDPGKAIEAYIDTIYLDKENDDYEELVSANKENLQDEALNEFGNMLQEKISLDLSDNDIEKYYKIFKEAVAEKSEVETKVTGNVNNKALVYLSYSSLSDSDLSDKIRDYKKKYREKNDNTSDKEAEEEYALSKFEKILDELEAEQADRDFQFIMEKEHGNWSFDDSYTHTEKDIRNVFAEGFIG